MWPGFVASRARDRGRWPVLLTMRVRESSGPAARSHRSQRLAVVAAFLGEMGLHYQPSAGLDARKSSRRLYLQFAAFTGDGLALAAARSRIALAGPMGWAYDFPQSSRQGGALAQFSG